MLKCTDQDAGLLMKLYGVDKGSLKKNLELILGKKQKLQPRKLEMTFPAIIAVHSMIGLTNSLILIQTSSRNKEHPVVVF